MSTKLFSLEITTASMLMNHSVPLHLLKKYAGEIPRYTSYPTAPNFTSEFDQSDYKREASRSNGDLLPRDLSLYVHIPFCHSLCYFCGCNKVITQCGNKKVDNYIDALLKEIELRSSLFDHDRKVTQIHFGGGTPNFIKPERLGEILDTIANYFHVDLPSKLEISIEVDPRAINPAGIHQLASLGFNRFSIGVQDFSTDVQLAVNRVQSERATLGVIKAAYEVSDSVNVDLITGLPKQSANSFANTLSKIIESGASRISAYNFAYLPERIKAQKLIDAKTLPNIEERYRLIELTRSKLRDAGFLHIGMDHYALEQDSLSQAYSKNTLQRNFQGYTTHAETDLVGLGASAISQFKYSFAQNHASLSLYTEKVENGEFPVSKGVTLSSDDVLRASLIQQIMCRNFVDLSINTRQFIESAGNDTLAEYFASELSKLRPFVEDGLATFDSTGFTISGIGSFFRRQMAAVFDAYLSQSSPENTHKVVRFSQAL